MVTVPKPMVAPFIDWINAVVEFLRKYEFLGLFTFKDVLWPKSFHTFLHEIFGSVNFFSCGGGFASTLPSGL